MSEIETVEERNARAEAWRRIHPDPDRLLDVDHRAFLYGWGAHRDYAALARQQPAPFEWWLERWPQLAFTATANLHEHHGDGPWRDCPDQWCSTVKAESDRVHSNEEQQPDERDQEIERLQAVILREAEIAEDEIRSTCRSMPPGKRESYAMDSIRGRRLRNALAPAAPPAPAQEGEGSDIHAGAGGFAAQALVESVKKGNRIKIHGTDFTLGPERLAREPAPPSAGEGVGDG